MRIHIPRIVAKKNNKHSLKYYNTQETVVERRKKNSNLVMDRFWCGKFEIHIYTGQIRSTVIENVHRSIESIQNAFLNEIK